jgi:hypothetical protein
VLTEPDILALAWMILVCCVAGILIIFMGD